jgi:hypothetical protein
VKFIGLDRMDARAKWFEAGERRREIVGAIFGPGIGSWRDGECGSESGASYELTSRRGRVKKGVLSWFVHVRKEVYLDEAQLVKAKKDVTSPRTSKQETQTVKCKVRNYIFKVQSSKLNLQNAK